MDPTLKAALESIRDTTTNALNQIERRMSSMRCVGSVSRAAIQSISRSLFHLEPAADALDAKVQSSDLFCEASQGRRKRFAMQAGDKLNGVS